VTGLQLMSEVVSGQLPVEFVALIFQKMEQTVGTIIRQMADDRGVISPCWKMSELLTKFIST
jgi:hypothetical protein